LSRLKRVSVATLASALMLSVMAAPAFAFHHGGLPSTVCAVEAAGSPSNDNGMAKERASLPTTPPKSCRCRPWAHLGTARVMRANTAQPPS
jgi:hypothetical protein